MQPSVASDQPPLSISNPLRAGNTEHFAQSQSEFCMTASSITRRPLRAAIIAAVSAATIVAGPRLFAADHQDTPEVELNARMDINDVYAFPGSSADRIVLAVTTSSPIAGSAVSFDPNLLYQIKVDNTGDAVEDLVFQVTFD